MLTLDINNEYLQLDPQLGILVRWNNPACFFDKIPGDVGVNISLPANEINRAILGNPEMFEKYSSGSDRKFTRATLAYGGVLLIAGTLVVQNATENYECWLQSDAGALGEAQQNKLITEMDWPTAQTFVDKTYYNDDTDDYGIQPLINQGFWEGKGKEETIKFQYTDENGNPATGEDTRSAMQANAIDNYSSWVNIYNLANILPGCVISPFLHLRYVIEKSLQLNQLFIDRNDMIDGKYNISYLKNTKIYNNFGIIDVSISGMRKKKIMQWEPETREFVFYFVDYFNPGWSSAATFNYADLLPKISYNDFLLGIQNFLNYIFRFRNDGKVDIIDRNQILNSAAFSLAEYEIRKAKPAERKNVRLKFLPQYDKDDSKFSIGFEDLSDRYADYGDAVETYADLELIASPDFGELRLVKDSNKVYEYTWMVVTDESDGTEAQVDAIGWKFATTGPQPYVYGTEPEVEEIKTAVSTLQQIGGYTPTLEAFQKGNIRSMRSLYSDFGLRLLPGNMTMHPEALYFEGDNGLFKNRWENWSRFWKNRLEVEVEFQLPLNILAYIIENVTGKFSIDGGEFIIEEITTQFGLTNVGTTRIKGYKV